MMAIMAPAMPKAERTDAEMDRWYTAGEACAYLGIVRPTLTRWVTGGKLRAYRLGGVRGELRFKRADLDALIEPVDPAEARASWKRKDTPETD